MTVKLELPKGYCLITESSKAVLALSTSKKEFVAWTKDAQGGVCWGRYYPYWNDTPREKAYILAYIAFNEKSK